MFIKSALVIGCSLLIFVIAANAQSGGAKEDQIQIERAISNWETAWKTKDFRLAAQDYSAEAQWTNAFGMTRNGRPQIESLLKEVFVLPFVMEGSSRTVEQTVRFLKPDVATVVTRVEREGQKAPSGETMSVRKTSHLRVFTRRAGKWQIDSHLISDARETESKIH